MSSTVSVAAEDVAAVQAVPARMIAAWSKNDADAFADLFTEDGSMVLPGDVYLNTREEIRAFMSEAYAGPYQGTRVTGSPLSAKFINQDSGVLVTQGGVLYGDETDVTEANKIRATWVLAKKDGAWFITAYHNSPVQTG
jgi:uncharacterized protein (TIGR02246 family)